MATKIEKDWFKLKKYPHIGLPLNPCDRLKWIEPYVTSKEEVAEHAFLPFIHRTARVKKFRKKYNAITGKLEFILENGKKVLRNPNEKKRELFYASHLDSLIFSYYSQQLNESYEDKLTDFNLNDVVNAYRSIPINPNKEDSSNKCNIDFANDVFKHILGYDQKEFSVIAFDISSFFDNLDHKLLREVWCDVLKVDKLPNDHFNVYKNITRFSHVDIVDIFEEFKDEIYTQKTNKFGVKLKRKRKKIDKIKFLRNQDAIAFCSEKEFFKVKNKLLQPSKTKIIDDKIVYRNFGIPQGSPISSVLANMYLLHFDKLINDFTSSVGGIYRRYSDDMIIVCPLNKKADLVELVYTEIKKYKLEIQPSKTQIFQFEYKNGKLECGEEYQDGKLINWNKNFIYLGFEFDGQTVLLKSASLSGYYRKMKRGIRRAKYYSQKTGNEIYKRRLLKRHTYKGAKRTRKYIWNEKEKKFIKSEYYNWGNFLSYAFKSADVMINNKIKQQTKGHWSIFNKELMKSQKNKTKKNNLQPTIPNYIENKNIFKKLIIIMKKIVSRFIDFILEHLLLIIFFSFVGVIFFYFFGLSAAENRFEIIIGVILLYSGIVYNLVSYKIANDQFFKSLFTEFNSRYDKLNEDLKAIRNNNFNKKNKNK